MLPRKKNLNFLHIKFERLEKCSYICIIISQQKKQSHGNQNQPKSS